MIFFYNLKQKEKDYESLIFWGEEEREEGVPSVWATRKRHYS